MRDAVANQLDQHVLHDHALFGIERTRVEPGRIERDGLSDPRGQRRRELADLREDVVVTRAFGCGLLQDGGGAHARGLQRLEIGAERGEGVEQARAVVVTAGAHRVERALHGERLVFERVQLQQRRVARDVVHALQHEIQSLPAQFLTRRAQRALHDRELVLREGDERVEFARVHV